MIIRKAEPKDLARIVQIEGLCFPEETAFPPGMFAYLIRYSVALVACEPEEEILGFVMGYTSGTYGAVYTLDVHPGYRRKGIGSALIAALEKKLAGMGAKAIRLEAALEKGHWSSTQSGLPGERAGKELLRAGKSCGDGDGLPDSAENEDPRLKTDSGEFSTDGDPIRRRRRVL